MKDACIIIAIILIIVAGDIWMQTYLTRTADEIGKNLQELKHNTILAKETDNRDEIKNEVSEIEKKWEEISKTWSTIVVHQEIDNIEQALKKSKSNIEEGDLGNA